ncbi:unnamed protein product [Cylicocyclus nassatus]|uniref:Uncharacterized protein n=1 Tax=Cylicocyclus nassatus TaxID=53992 RepID=A0AA36MD01_CYLNA|nr:unnamed protein product [Cylicocyclus nassatus]CAJ0607743.1 unnamed protein product [Cylicocyclus nassatus]
MLPLVKLLMLILLSQVMVEAKRWFDNAKFMEPSCFTLGWPPSGTNEVMAERRCKRDCKRMKKCKGGYCKGTQCICTKCP